MHITTTLRTSRIRSSDTHCNAYYSAGVTQVLRSRKRRRTLDSYFAISTASMCKLGGEMIASYSSVDATVVRAFTTPQYTVENPPACETHRLRSAPLSAGIQLRYASPSSSKSMH
jgi:hypothetical protein